MKCDWLVLNKLSFITENDVKHILTTNFLSQISVALLPAGHKKSLIPKVKI